ncbi:hypothetical protein [Phenylobacterium sp.]|uniref:hypothetical protein n=1 Tax=Phenylobacterium sp. TaxID=1871053 RepID=UPI002F410B2A
MNLDWLDLLDDERRRDATGVRAWRQEVDRHRGVCWSGLALQPPRTRSEDQLEAAAQARLRKLQAWRASATGRFLAAVSRAQQAAEAAHFAGESARAAVSRDFEGSASVCRGAADMFDAQGRALLAAARAARRALRIHGEGEAEQEPHGAC